MVFPFYIFILLVSFGIQFKLVDAQCLDSEALFQVSYSFVNSEDQNQDDLVVELHVIPSINARNESIQKEYPWNENFVYELCLPRENSCGQIAIFGPPKEQFEVSWDGEPMTMTDDVVPTIRHDLTIESTTSSNIYERYLTAMEFGNNCVLECAENEALFENQYRTTANYKISIEPYIVQDQNGNTIIAHKEQTTYDTFLYIERYCLPRDEGNCYRLIMGDRVAISEASDEGEHISISYDGVTLLESQAWYYESFDFGDGCPGTGVKSCDPTQESMLEFFMTTKIPDVTWPKLSWEVLMHHENSSDGNDTSEVIHSGIQSNETGVSLQYDSICVPKQSCVTFSILAVEDDMRRQYTTLDYEISLDKTIYRKQQFNSLLSSKVETAIIGECTELKSPICNPAVVDENEAMALLDLSFQTTSGTSSSDPDSTTRSSNNRFPYYAGSWYVSESNDMTAWILQSSDFIDDFEYGSSYRVLHCIPKEECTYSLFVNQRADFDTYSIRLDGSLSTSDAIEVDDAELTFASYYVTSLDDSCNDHTPLSKGQIAVIIISVLVVVGVLIIGALYVIRRRKYSIEH